MGRTSTSTLSCNKPDGTGEVWLQTPGNGTAELPEQLPPSRVCVPTAQRGSPEPRVKPGADPARARREQQQGKAEGAELSPGTRRVGRGRARQALEKQEGNQVFAWISSRDFRNSFKSVPSTSSLSQARQHTENNNLWVALVNGIVPGKGHRGFPGAAFRPCSTQQPWGLPSAPSQIRIWVQSGIKMIQTQKMDLAVAHRVSSCLEHDPVLPQPSQAEAPAQLPSQSSSPG